MIGFSALSAYLHELRRHSLLSRDEEHELAVRFSKTGDSRRRGGSSRQTCGWS